MKKFYVLDTNVILHNPNAILSFEDNIVVIPKMVIEELDKKKKGDGELARNARTAGRILTEALESPEDVVSYRFHDANNVCEFSLPNEGTLRIYTQTNDSTIPNEWMRDQDYYILNECCYLKKHAEKMPVILVSNDNFIKVKASLLNIEVQEFATEMAPDVNEQYTGRRNAYLTSDDMSELFSGDGVSPDKLIYRDEDDNDIELPPLTLNEYIIIKDVGNPSSSAITYYDGEKVVPLEDGYNKAAGIKPKNVGQRLAMHAVKSSKELAIIKGPAGTGKTLIALAAGLEAVWNGDYRRILYLRSNVKSEGEDIGFLKGTEEDKLEWALRPVRDNLEKILENKGKDNYSSATITRKGKKRFNSEYDKESDDKSFITDELALQDKIDEIFERRQIVIEAVGFMRGRSIANHFVIIDEAQNLTPKQIRTLLTRASEGTKIVLIGDSSQIDNRYLGPRTNGLSVAAQDMAGSPTTIQMTFMDDECERSRLSREAASRMGDK